MLSALVFLLAQENPLAQLDRLAQTRDAAALEGAHPQFAKGTFDFLRRTGAFGGGRFGWRVVPMVDPVSQEIYVVFTTPITVQDYGEQIFGVRDNRLSTHFREEDRLGIRPLNYDMQVNLDPQTRTARFVTKVSFEKDAPTRQSFFVRLSGHYEVTSVTDTAGRPVRFAQAGGVVVVPTPATQSFSYTFTYAGQPNLERYAGVFKTSDVMLTGDYFWPSVGRWPATSRISVTGPETWQLIANGNRAEERVAGGQRTSVFVSPVALSYFSLAAGPYRQARGPAQGVVQAAWSDALTEEQLKTQLELQRPVIEFYANLMGQWPYKGFVSVDSGSFHDGALEGYSMATYARGWLPDDDPHEPGHTLFGGVISNTYLKSFWNESFATFLEGYYQREVPIGNQAERRMAFVVPAFAAPSYRQGLVGSTGVAGGNLAVDLGYGKGGLVLQMLELELGTERMTAAMREWLTTHPKGTPGEWEDFEKVVGDQYDWFFEQWLRRAGWPEFTISNVRWEDGQLKGKVAFRGDPYRLTVEVMTEDPVGARQYNKVILNPNARDAESEFSMPLEDEPLLVVFDPWDRILTTRQMARPRTLENELPRMDAVIDPAHKEWSETAEFKSVTVSDVVPQDLNGKVLVGHPDTVPQMKPLLDQVGFRVEGDQLTFDGTTIDLREGAAAALIDLGDGKRCAVVLGTVKARFKPGRTRIAVTDGFGRFLRGVAEPRREGSFVFRL